MQRLAGAGKGHHGLGIEAFLLGEDLGQVLFHIEQVAAAPGNDVDHGLARGFAGSQGILVGVDVDALVGIGEMGRCGVARGAASVRMRHAGQCGGAGGKAEEAAAGKAATG